MKRIVLVDSEQSTGASLRDRLASEGHSIIDGDAVPSALSAVRVGEDAVILYAPPQGVGALEPFQQLRAVSDSTPVLLVSGSPTEALQTLGADGDGSTRPSPRFDEMPTMARRALSEHGRPAVYRGDTAPVLVGNHPALRGIREAMARFGQCPTPGLLITGESGTGKATVTRLLYLEAHRTGPWLCLPCEGGGAEPSLEAELFGFESEITSQPGLLERAHGGTLFLGDICRLPWSLQSGLCRYLEGRAVHRLGSTVDRWSDARLVASSSRGLDRAVREGLLLPELADRFARATTLELPPLRERLGDLEPLAEHFLGRLTLGHGKRLSAAALQRMREHDWPGNLRELSNVLEIAGTHTDAPCLEPEHLPPLTSGRARFDYRLPSDGIEFRELERELLLQALRLASGNQTRAATLLGLSRDQIRYRMAKFGMTSRDLDRVHAA